LVLGKLKEKLPKVRSGKTFLIQVPRRGGSVLLGKIKAKDIVDAQKTLLENIHQFVHNPAVRSAKYIHLIDVETGEKFKVENPLYSGGDEEEKPKKSTSQKAPDIEDLKNMLQLELAERIGKEMAAAMGEAMRSVGRTMGEVYASLFKEIAETYKEMLKNQIAQPQQPATGYIEILKIILDAVKNWDKIKKYAPEILRTFKQQLMEGEKGGSAGEGEEGGEQG